MTTLVKRSPLVELEPMDRWLNTMLSGIGFGPALRPHVPAADVYVANGTYVIELEVPGFAEQELAVQVEGRILTVTGTHVEKEGEKSFRIHERLASEFARTFLIPPEVEIDKITSSFAHGVLKVFAPLPATVAPRTIPITPL